MSIHTDGTGSVPVLGDQRNLSKGERQRRAILDGLVEMLESKPISEISVADIAAASGVRRSGFYFYFESKYAPLAVVTSEIWSELLYNSRTYARVENESGPDFLRRVTHATVEIWRQHDAILTASVEAISLDDQLASVWRDWNGRLTAVLTEQIRLDIASGAARPVVLDISGLVSNLLEMSLHLFYRDRLDHHSEEQTERMLDMVSSVWDASIWGSSRPSSGWV